MHGCRLDCHTEREKREREGKSEREGRRVIVERKRGSRRGE
jgi:hypothetical protein